MTLVRTLMALLLLCGLSFGQEEEAKKDDLPEVKQACEALDKAYKDKDDDAAKSGMRALVDRMPNAGPKDQKKMLGAFARAYDQRRDDKGLYVGATVALGACGAPAAATLQAAFAHKAFKKDPEMLRLIAVEIGRTLDEKSVSFLVDLLDFKFFEVTAGAAEGMSFFHSAPLKTRKLLVGPLVKALESASNDALDLQNVLAKERYGIIGSPIIDALQKLSGQNLRQPLEWTKWWNDNKKATDW
ncbi:MAG: hypothetical protein JNM84_22245 [Planctomycetes bacterium]|nr:hypothetical protein [Planctomycetota bacterium]